MTDYRETRYSEDMSVSLPDINVAALTTLKEAKDALGKVMNFIEYLLKRDEKREKEIVELRKEIARLKGQPKRPRFPAARNEEQSTSVTRLLSQKQTWKKGIKGNLPVDRDVELSEVDRCICGSCVFRTLRTFRKTVQGMIVARNNVCYHGREKQCISCGTRYKSVIPKELKGVSFDPTLRSLVSFFKYGCRMTQPLIHQMLKGFGIRISTGTISDILLHNGEKLNPAYQELKTTGYTKSPYLQSDATGAKRKEKTGRIRNHYVQIIANRLLSVFFITKYYNMKTLSRLLGTIGRKKPYVSDDGSPNGDGLWVRVKQLCWVHEIRHYKKLFPVFTSYRRQQIAILSQWKLFYHVAKHYGHDPTKRKRKRIERMFAVITSQTTGYALLDKQLRTTGKKKGRLLTFLDHPFLPIHNNQCEQDVREFVIQRNISHETKSVAGDKSLVRHLSIIQTAQKQGLDVFSVLHGLLTGQLSPSVLTATIS